MTEQQSSNGLEPQPQRDMTRRRAVVAGGAAVAAAGLGAAVATTASAGETSASASSATPSAATSSPSGEVCYRLTSETTEGPYYIDADKIRKDITEGKEGIPMTLRLKVIDSDSCKPMAKAAVDIWHCDALGLYSGYESSSSGGGGTPPTGTPPTGTPPTDAPTGAPTGAPPGGGHQEPTDDKRYLRGTQLTDRHGFVEFTTVFPGWYRGRCVHIHTKVHIGGKLTDDGYEGGHTCHTGQLFFAEEAVLDSAKVAPYNTSTTPRTTLDEDGIYPGNGAQGGLLHLKYRKGKIEKGVVGSLTLGVDPDATHDGTDL
ncbi:intradiol ring-cleavage dioxygenase [Streptomyces iranensis]|uniref:Intradiol ring-cleavage dioxygenase n=1 Tax=Streptomyces iranensis TaxID=576784 RepID=A0A060ZQ51_9ACTN|nr:intradiol ring-cleavage dioxygenase [Streptomyces iranensis]MBP2065923.1 protocatechuate 3,4-dioxygenase beta subunit [Streptomyces iranensis]CDR08312.1 intradiol ring-cleavage dioxygenase [Streptomyces iranensis]